ncbi:MAG: bifunctional cbb3-type cytochrome c oxidase subunit [Deltaproteobacteria bacterium]|nr:bifunctional cbb3-type cytochrome c oxidase subunit [Deltaproteobacteria bacterium]
MAWNWHRPLEAKGVTFTVLTLLTILVGGLVELVPPYFLQGTIDPIDGVKPYTALELEGRDLYIREGCNNCHSQMIRPFKAETDRYGPFTMPGEGIYDRPFLYGSRRTGPDLSRVGGKYPDSWHWIHFRNPREIEPRSIMPPYAFMMESPLDLSLTKKKLEVLHDLGHDYDEAQIQNAAEDARAQAERVAASLRKDGKALSDAEAHSETIALIAYIQRLGTDIRWREAAAGAGGGLGR